MKVDKVIIIPALLPLLLQTLLELYKVQSLFDMLRGLLLDLFDPDHIGGLYEILTRLLL